MTSRRPTVVPLQRVVTDSEKLELTDLRQRITEVYQLHHEALSCFLLRSLSNKDDVEDIAQEVYIRLLGLKNLEWLQPNARAYIFQIGKNLIRDRYRKKSNQVHHQDIDNEKCVGIANPGPGPDETLIWQQRLGCVGQSVQELPEQVRQAFLLHRFREISHQEIAACMGVSKKTVQRRIAMALMFIHSKLEKSDEIAR